MAPFPTSPPCFGNIAQFFCRENPNSLAAGTHICWFQHRTQLSNTLFSPVLDLSMAGEFHLSNQNWKEGGVSKLCYVPIWSRNKSWLFERKMILRSQESSCRQVNRFELRLHRVGKLTSPNLIYNGAAVRSKQKQYTLWVHVRPKQVKQTL